MKRKKITLETVEEWLNQNREILCEMERDLADPNTSEIIRLTRRGQVESVREDVKRFESQLRELKRQLERTEKVEVKFT
jgi:predicted translin family RNA/ssDNA-binding protein